MSKIIANQIQAIGGSALTLPTTHPSSDSNLKVSTSGVISYEAAGGGGVHARGGGKGVRSRK